MEDEYSESLFKEYSKKCVEEINQLFNVVKILLELNNKNSLKFESMFNNILSDSSSINSISEMYFNFFKPTFEFIFKQLKPKNMDDLYFASKKAYVMMMVSLILLARNLNMVVNACCHNTAQICGQIELFDQDIELNKINECLVLINPKIKLNTVFNLTTPEIPANLLNLYIKFYKKRLENPMMKNSLIYLDSINENLMGLSKVNLNSLRSILKYLVINVPKEIQAEIPFIENMVNDGEMIDNYLGPIKCAGKRKTNEKFEINKDCLFNLENVLKQMQEASLKYLNKIDNEKKKDDPLFPMIQELLKNLQDVNTIAHNYINESEQQLNADIQKMFKDIDYDPDHFSENNIKRFSQIIKVVNKLTDYIADVDEKMHKYMLVKKYYNRLKNIEKNIDKYATEATIRSEYFLLSFVCVDWIDPLFKLVSKNPFSWLPDFNSNFNPKYMLVLGSINTRPVDKFTYENSPFFDNKKLIENIYTEYYTSLDMFLGNLFKTILSKMVEPDDPNHIFTTLELEKEGKMYTGKKKKNSDYIMCYASASNINKSLNMIHFSIDFLLSMMAIREFLYPGTINIHLTDFLKGPCCNLTNIALIRFLITSIIINGKIKGSNWSDCYIESNSDLNSELIKQIDFLKSSSITVSDNKICINLVNFKKGTKKTIDYNKLNTFMKNLDEYPNIKDFYIENNEKGEKFVPTFLNSDKFKILETKFILLNKIGNIYGSSLLYNYNDYTFELIDIDKTELFIHL